MESRLVPYSVSGNLWPNASLITVSFVPDGTLINGQASNMQATFNAKWPTATWQNVFKKAAQSWAQQSNINFNFVADSGAAFGAGNNQQGDPNFGDIRIGGYNFGAGNTTLATAYLPPPINNYSIAGDIAFNTATSFNIGSSYDLYTVATHEFGHALGLYHGAVGSVMASSYPGTKTALATDDINGIRNIYSSNASRAKDSYDAVAANETFATAKLVTTSINTTSKTALIADRDLSTNTDVDWYKFVVPSGSSTTLKVKAVATGLSLLNPKIEIYNSSNALKATGNGGGYGTTASTSFTGVAAGQTWYVKVSSADAIAAFKTGKYALVLNMGTGSDPIVTPPSTTLAKGATPSAGGGIAVAYGVEELVNTNTDGNQSLVTRPQHSIVADANGNHVVVWTGVDESGRGIFAQRYNAEGVKVGAEFRINSTTHDDQFSPSVAMNGAGEFIVVWTSAEQDGSGLGIYGQKFDADGLPQGGEFRINATTANDQTQPAVALDAQGNFVVTWSSFGQDTTDSWGIYARRYSYTGAASNEFRANSTVAGDQFGSGVALGPLGNFVIGWSSYGQDSNNSWGVYYQQYTLGNAPVLSTVGQIGASVLGSIVPVLGETRANTTTKGDQILAAAALDANGNFTAVWTSTEAHGTDRDILAQRFDGTGLPLGTEFQINTTTVGDQTTPSINSDQTGGMIVTWASYGQDGSGWGIIGQQLSSSGQLLEGEFIVNTTTEGDQVAPCAVMDNQGRLIIAWSGNGVGDEDGVFLRRYSVNTSAVQSAPVSHDYDPEGHDHDHHDHDLDHDSSSLGNSSSSDHTSEESDARISVFVPQGQRREAGLQIRPVTGDPVVVLSLVGIGMGNSPVLDDPADSVWLSATPVGDVSELRPDFFSLGVRRIWA